MGLEDATFHLFLEVFSCIDPGIAVRDIAVVFNERMITDLEYASGIVMDIGPKRRHTDTYKLGGGSVFRKNLWPKNDHKKMLADRPRRDEQGTTS